MQRVKNFSEVNMDFVCPNSHAFHLDMPSSYRSLYLRPPGNNVVSLIADKLVTVCATLNEYPHIRFCKASGLCREVAQAVHEKLIEFMSNNPGWWFHGGQR